VHQAALYGCRLCDALKWITHLVGPVGAVPCVASIGAGQDGEGRTRVSGDEGVELPTSCQPCPPLSKLRYVIEQVARKQMPVIKAGIAPVEPSIVVIGRPVIARERLLVHCVTERVGELRAEVVPTAGADRQLERVVARICSGLDFSDPPEL